MEHRKDTYTRRDVRTPNLTSDILQNVLVRNMYVDLVVCPYMCDVVVPSVEPRNRHDICICYRIF